ncbi:TPA: response regulator [Candidatus Bathyarchaeota archaeon]|nr:response regulator [Candidatus Bathyarchaeota archaeon]
MSDRKILLVEDNPDDIELTTRAFAKHKLVNKIDIARDGVEAIDYLKRKNDLPSVVLLDIKLPKVNGLEVLQFIRQNEATQLLPVVILTSSKEERDLIQSYKLGANSFVRKPVDFDEFMNAVKELGLYWLLLNENPYK